MQHDTDRALRTSALFTALALGFSIVYWMMVSLSRSGVVPFSMESDGFFRASVPGSVAGLLLRDFGPALAGVIAIAVCRGRSALRGLLRSIVRWRVPAWLYVVAWFGLALNAGVIVAGLAIGTLQFDPTAFVPMKFVMLFFVMALLDGPLGEEIGWRGVLLPELLRRLSPVSAAVIVGVVWYAWHVPLYAADDKLPGLAEHAIFLYTCIALSLIFTWFFMESRASTFLMVYLHNATNYSTLLRFKLFAKVGESRLPALVYVVLLLIGAVLATLALARRARLEAVAAGPHLSNGG
jgi:membrane protease YdiL (CAAX protease family)